MAELSVGAAARQSVRPSFFLWMTVAMAALVFGGFSLTYFIPMATGTLQAVPPVTHVHGAVYFSWMLLLVYQAVLVHRRRVVTHRGLGLLGIAIASALVILGTLVTVLFARSDLADPAIYGVTYISLVAIVAFGSLFALAMRNLNDPAAHKRYVLMATLAFVIGALNRIFAVLFDVGFDTHATYLPKYLCVDVFVLAMLAYDWRTLGAPHRATLIGAFVNVVPQVLHVPIVDSAAFIALTQWLASIAYFR